MSRPRTSTVKAATFILEIVALNPDKVRAYSLYTQCSAQTCYYVPKSCSPVRPTFDWVSCRGFAVRTADAHFHVLPMASGGISRLAYTYASEKRIDVNSLLPKAGLTREQIDDPEARLNVTAQIRFLELAATALRDDFLGFHLARKFDLRTIGLFYYVLASSENSGRGFAAGGWIQQGSSMKGSH